MCGGLVPMPAAGTCVKPATCGGNGDKPCTLDIQVSQGRTSCDKGLIEDFVNNRCARPDAALAEASCRAVVGAINAGRLPDPFKPHLDEAKKVAAKLKKADAKAEAQKFIATYGAVVGELQKIHQQLAAQRELFLPDVLCVPSALKARLTALASKLEPVVKAVLPRYSGHFYMAYSLNAGAAAGPGVAAGYTIVTDYQGDVGVYAYLGPSAVSNASLGDSVGVQFFPVVAFDSFEGWGWGFGVEAGPPTKVFSGAAEVAFEALKPVGIGISGAIGVGALPAEVSVTATHAWKLWSQQR